MLVLSRRQGQRVHFPTLNMSARILPSRGNTVRLGIQAPPEVSVLREELVPQGQVVAHAARRAWDHDTRGRLNTAVMGLYLAQKQLQAGLTADAAASLREALLVLEALDRTLADQRSQPPAGPCRTALLVEDDHNEKALLAGYLSLNGFRIDTAHDGYEALDFLARNERPDFVLLDMRLPRCDGPATVTAIRRNPAYDGMKIFAVTGSAPQECDVAVGPGGVDGWFRKPLNPARLVESLHAAGGLPNV
jgi:carbon storage regulator CsrA